MDVIGVCDILRHWYRKHTGRIPKPLIISLEGTKAVYDDLFNEVELDSEIMPYKFEYDGPEIYDNAPKEEEIVFALYKIRNRKASGMIEITVEDLMRWEIGENPRKEEIESDQRYVGAWQKVVNIIQ